MNKLKTKKEVEAWLSEMGIYDYTIEKDLTINVHSGVTFHGTILGSFPVQFGKVEGNFDCSSNELTSLKGSPREVAGNFYCQENNLTTLEGGPIKVGESFACADNKLTSLEFCPEEVGENFFIDTNKIANLDFFPRWVEGDVLAYNTPIETILGFSCNFGGKFLHTEFIIPELEDYYVDTFGSLDDGSREHVLEMTVEEMKPIVRALTINHSLVKSREENDNLAKKKVKL